MSVKRKFCELIDEIIKQETEKESVADIQYYEWLEIENNPYMNLKIERVRDTTRYKIGHYFDGINPDPEIEIDFVTFDIHHMKQQTAFGVEIEENEKKIEDFIQMIWYNNLKTQFDLYGDEVDKKDWEFERME
jgi:hypothetical protein